MQNIIEHIEKAKLGDEYAIRCLIQDCQDGLYRYIFRMVRNEFDAQDLTQETLILIFRNMSKLKKAEAYYSWIYQIAYRTVLRHSRSKKRQNYLRLSEVSFAANEDVREENEEDFMSLEILGNLKLSDKTLLYLRVAQELDFKEIEEILGIRSATLRKRYQRLREKLRKELTVKEKRYV